MASRARPNGRQQYDRQYRERFDGQVSSTDDVVRIECELVIMCGRQRAVLHVGEAVANKTGPDRFARDDDRGRRAGCAPVFLSEGAAAGTDLLQRIGACMASEVDPAFLDPFDGAYVMKSLRREYAG